MALESHGPNIQMESGKLSAQVYDDGLACGPDLMRIVDSNIPDNNDRRRRVRIPLSWCVYLGRPGESKQIEGITKNVSVDGLYCFVQEPFRIGELLHCVIVVPASGRQPDDALNLDCRVEVVRVEPLGAGKYGIACHIEEYRILTVAARSRQRGKQVSGIQRLTS